VGSAVQLSTYDSLKNALMRSGYPVFAQDTLITHLGASMLCSLVVCAAMNPFDVISTRLYNQARSSAPAPAAGVAASAPPGSHSHGGALYSGPIDCARKTFHSEGVRGFYKGVIAHYLRIGPHTVSDHLISAEPRLCLFQQAACR